MYWCSILELVRTHFSEKIPSWKFGNPRTQRVEQSSYDGKAAPARRSISAGGEPHRWQFQVFLWRHSIM